MSARDDNPAALADHDPAWAERAAGHLADVRAALADLPGIEEADFDHIGSTSVPGLAAKPFLDLQLRVLPLPSHAELAERLAPIGFTRAQGARPDSPGVDRDSARGDEDVAAAVWEKRLYVARDHAAVLHVRRSDSPWGRHTVRFRDWLRAHPAERRRYEDTKRRLAGDNAGKADYDDYTRAKTTYFDEVHDAFTSWARRSS